jgi:hypothetical protein
VEAGAGNRLEPLPDPEVTKDSLDHLLFVDQASTRICRPRCGHRRGAVVRQIISLRSFPVSVFGPSMGSAAQIFLINSRQLDSQ